MLPSKIEDVFEEELNTFWLLTDDEKIDPKTELRRLTFRLDLLKLDQATYKSIKYLMPTLSTYSFRNLHPVVPNLIFYAFSINLSNTWYHTKLM